MSYSKQILYIFIYKDELFEIHRYLWKYQIYVYLIDMLDMEYTFKIVSYYLEKLILWLCLAKTVKFAIYFYGFYYIRP